MVSSEPELVTESWPAAKLTTVVPLVTTTLGNPGYGHTVQLRLGPAFGKRRIVRTVNVRTPLTQELQRTPLISSRQDGDIRARDRVVFTRCRGTAPC